MSNDAAILGHLLRALADTCRYCGCHGDSCKVGPGDLCGWMDDRHTLCSYPACLARAAVDKKKYQRGLNRNGSKNFKRRAA